MKPLIIQTHQLRYRYSRQDVVRELALEVAPGSVYGFLGPNGAGKSTTIKLILGLLQPSAGDIQVFGQSLRNNRHSVLSRIGSLIEAPSLYGNLTARENLRWLDHLFGKGPRRIEEVLELVDLSDAADRLVRQFSMGMKQRLGIAMALYHDPDLLILDEPVNGLDPAGIQEMRQLFQRLKEAGKTLFVSSHILAEIEKIATHIGIIQQGELRFQGPVEKLWTYRQSHTVLRVSDSGKALQVVHSLGMEGNLLPEGELKVIVGEGPDYHRLLASLFSAGVELYRAQINAGTLEDLFLELTQAGPSALQVQAS